MDGVKAFLATVAISLFSCQSKEDQLIGHWHEYEKGNPDFINCHKITDSTYSVDLYTYGSGEPMKRGTEIKKSEIAIQEYVFSSNFSISNNKLIINDSIYWIKQEDNEQTFIADFSAGLLVNIHPFETNATEFDYKKNTKHLEVLIYIGTLKKSTLTSYKEYNSKEHYIQLNDKIVNVYDIKSYLDYGVHHDERIKVVLHTDKNTPKPFLSQIETEILNCGYKRNQIYYLTVNTQKKLYGYNNRN
ncbi:hypothetical protein FIA58_005780 [Flavobacterium jejuense]|uniref:Lipocalin-like domain-containing protein n=1 Tax=Flavobacterium jejuense TaxID=1544455 RepID=A0ABX0IMZ7_9FLAO|nr:hypothetical protein [Flavobacterium jejuense]NHN25184.1 hypothetical protein [Flavobacterium jejuense]